MTFWYRSIGLGEARPLAQARLVAVTSKAKNYLVLKRDINFCTAHKVLGLIYKRLQKVTTNLN